MDGATINIQFYLMKALEEGKGIEKRVHHWFSLNEAIKAAIHHETKKLLSMAEQKRTQK